MGRKYLLLGAIAVASLSMVGGAFANMDDVHYLGDVSLGSGIISVDDVFGFYPEDPNGDMVPGGTELFMTVSAVDNFVINDGLQFDPFDGPLPMLDRKDLTMPSRASAAPFDLAVAGGGMIFVFDINKLDLGTQKHYGLGGTNAGVAPLAS